jgi:hypothetical protein
LYLILKYRNNLLRDNRNKDSLLKGSLKHPSKDNLLRDSPHRDNLKHLSSLLKDSLNKVNLIR